MKHVKELSRKMENVPSEALCLFSYIEYKTEKISDEIYIILNNYKN